MADNLLTETTAMMSATTVLTSSSCSGNNNKNSNCVSSSKSSSKPNSNNNNKSSSTPPTGSNNGVSCTVDKVVNDADKRNIQTNNNNGTHVNSHNRTKNGNVGADEEEEEQQQHNNVNGSDTVDKAMAPAVVDLLTGGDAESAKQMNRGGDEKTTTKSTKSVENCRIKNGINCSPTTTANLAVDQGKLSRSNSRTSCGSLNGHNNNNDDVTTNPLNSLEGHGDSTPPPATTGAGITTVTTTTQGSTNSDTLKKKLRLSSGRQQTKKAKRVRFFRNGDKFYSGLVLPVSYERYRSFESLTEDLTRVLGESIKVPGAVRTIFTVDGKKVASLEDLEDGKCYVCSCNNEVFKRLEYSTQNNKLNNRLSRVFRPSSPHKNGMGSGCGVGGVGGGGGGVAASPTVNLSERDTVVFPRIVTLIRNGVKPRRICRLLLNKRNSPSYEHVLTAITQRVHLDTGCVRKVFSLDGIPVLSLSDFFQHDMDVFFAYGNERVGADDFDLDAEETRQINQLHKTLKTGQLLSGLKPKMPGKSHNETFECVDENFLMVGLQGNDSLPAEIKNRYTIGRIIGDGNFAVVLKVTEKATNKDFALKIIDKSKCLGKEHYIDAEIRIMKMLDHPHIISLISDRDTARHTYLVMELVNGGDLFDAITRVTRFSEGQSRVMIKHLAAAMAYLHNLGICHRDVKPENLLVELDEHGNVLMLKLADFGLACEVDEPLLAVCGTPTYVAPEILMETGYGLKIDVWAAGIILYILLCGFPPFVSPDNQQEPLFDAILSGVYEFPEPYWNDIGDGVRDLIANMLQSDPELRFSSEDILDHFWVLDEEATSAVLQY